MFKRAKYHLPKFEPPQIKGLYRRDRLFRLLDKQSDKRMIWVSAPAGTGKTSLIASYLTERDKNLIWYQVDAADADIASFFHHLALCIKNAYPKKRGMLPDFTSEYLNGLPVFSVNYFRELFKKVEPGSVLVLDNFQDAGEELTLHEVMQYAVKEIPRDVQLVILSRVDPPCLLAQLQSLPDFSLLTIKDIHFDRTESDDVAGLRSELDLDEEQYVRLYELTQGWAAGLILTLVHLNKDPDFLSHQQFDDRNVLFNYLANEILSEFDEVTRDVLLSTSILHRITVKLAIKLTGEARCSQIFQKLTSDNLLTTKHDHIDGSFEYHPLLREFLVSELEKKHTKDELIQLHDCAGKYLLDDGNVLEAAKYVIYTSNWDRLTGIIIEHASKLLDIGVFKTVLEWIENIPEDVKEAEPWLYYWQGNLVSQTVPEDSLVYLKKAYYVFFDRNDNKGCYITWTTIVDSILLAWFTFGEIPHWIEELDKLNRKFIRPPGVELKIRVAISAFSAMMHTNPGHMDFPKRLKRIEVFQFAIPVKIARHVMAAQLSHYYMLVGDTDKQTCNSQILNDIENKYNLYPVITFYKHMSVLYTRFLQGEYDEVLAGLKKGKYYAEIYGVETHETVVYAMQCWAYICKNDFDAADKVISYMPRYISPSKVLDVALLNSINAIRCLCDKKYSEALPLCEESIEQWKACEAIFYYHYSRIMLAQIYIAMERYVEANDILVDDEKDILELKSHPINYIHKCTRAWFYIRNGESTKSVEDIQDAFAIGARLKLFSSYIWHKELMKEISVLAFKNNIHREYTVALIKKNNLLTTEEIKKLDDWPWPVKIYTMGRFVVLNENKSIDITIRQLELLRVILSYGGRDVPEEKIMDSLWPDSDGDQAKQNFKTTLHRLRKSFPEHDVLILNGRKLSLDDRYCWLDVWDIDRLMRQIENIKSDKEKLPKLELSTRKLIDCYEGEFLKGESEFWTISARERMRNSFSNCIIISARQLEKNNKIESAIIAYQKLIEVNPLFEKGYQGLMRCHIMSKQYAAAKTVYKKCVDILKEELDVAPSKETEEFYLKIKK